jgi:hypothetical protein
LMGSKPFMSCPERALTAPNRFTSCTELPLSFLHGRRCLCQPRKLSVYAQLSSDAAVSPLKPPPLQSPDDKSLRARARVVGRSTVENFKCLASASVSRSLVGVQTYCGATDGAGHSASAGRCLCAHCKASAATCLLLLCLALAALSRRGVRAVRSVATGPARHAPRLQRCAFPWLWLSPVCLLRTEPGAACRHASGEE